MHKKILFLVITLCLSFFGLAASVKAFMNAITWVNRG
jgi:hypothetical protein